MIVRIYNLVSYKPQKNSFMCHSYLKFLAVYQLVYTVVW